MTYCIVEDELSENSIYWICRLLSKRENVQNGKGADKEERRVLRKWLGLLDIGWQSKQLDAMRLVASRASLESEF